jgi:hypothetical protein
LHTVRPGDLAPDHAVLAAVDGLVGLVDVGNLFAQVKAGLLLVCDALDLQEGRVGLLVALAPGEALSKVSISFRFRPAATNENPALGVQSARRHGALAESKAEANRSLSDGQS